MISSSRGLFSRFVGDLLWSGGVLLLAADLALAFRAGRVPTATVLGADALIITGGLVARLVSAMNKAEAPTFALAVIAAVCLGAAGLGDRLWLSAAAAPVVAGLAPHIVSPRRSVVWMVTAMLMAVPVFFAPTALIPAPGPGVGAAVLGFVVVAGLSSFLFSVRMRQAVSAKEVELEMALDMERHRVAQLQTLVGQQEGKERRLERRAMLRSTLARRLGTIEAVAQVMARELEAALTKAAAGGLDVAAQRAVHWSDQLSRLAGGGKAREHQTTLSQVWPRVQSLVAISLLPTHTVRSHLPAVMPPVVGSGEAWVQVLAALIENAVDTMPGGGLVDVRQEEAPKAGHCRVSVTDAGPGMTEAEIAAILRLDPAAPAHGAGLGLAMVIAVVEGLGGEFTIESAPGQGTRIELDIPFAEGTAPAEDRQALEGRVLLADDDESVRRTAVRMLSTLGLEVVEADSGTVARGLLNAHEPGYFRAAVLDVVMPGTPIEDVIVGMRQRDPGFPVLLVSGYDTLQMVDAVLALGGVRFLRKPFKRADLYRALQDLFSIEQSPPPA